MKVCDTSQVNEWFALGNYIRVAIEGGPECWQTYAAMGLVGKTQEAIMGLSRFNHEEARFYSAVASWIAGDENTSMAVLSTLSIPHAQQLLDLIRKPQIQVLAQLPWASVPYLTTGMEADGKFQVTQVPHFHPYANIHDYYEADNPPDFYICQMVEWHWIPPNIQELSCPIFGQTGGDIDVHCQAVFPWFQLFDEILTADQEDWENLRQMVCIPVSIFPKIFGVKNYPPITAEKTIDVSQTNVLNPYHPEKADLALQIFLRAPGIEFYVSDNFLDEYEYRALLEKSKVCYGYVRVATGITTRALESLNAECVTLVQKGTALTLWAGEEEGVLTYEYKNGTSDLPDRIQYALNHWQQFKYHAKKGAKIIRREFSVPKIASQYLRFLTFLAAKPERSLRQRQNSEHLLQKRSILKRGWLPASGNSQILWQLAQTTVYRLKARFRETALVSTHWFIDTSREIVLYQVGFGNLKDEQWKSQCLQIYRAGIAKFPQSLVLRFNFIRVILHFSFSRQEMLEALELAKATLSEPEGNWQVDAMEDVFPWDFFETFFNYRKYFSQVVEHLKRNSNGKSNIELVRLILASLNYYVGHYHSGLSCYEKATLLDPNFPFYKLAYAKGLIKQGRFPLAISLLIELVESSMLFYEAISLLRELHKKISFHNQRFEELDAVFREYGYRLRGKPTPPSFLSLRFTVYEKERVGEFEESFGIIKTHKVHNQIDNINSASGDEVISILIPTLNRSEYLIRALNYYRKVGFKGYICIGDSSDDQHAARIRQAIQTLGKQLKIVYHYFLKSSHGPERVTKALIELAPTPYLAFSGDDDFLVPNSLGQCAIFLDHHPEYAAAHGFRVTFYPKLGKVVDQIIQTSYVQQHILESDKASERWTGYMRHAYSTQFYVQRKETWRRMYRDVSLVPVTYLGPELMPCGLSAIQGKVKQLDCISTLFQNTPGSDGSWSVHSPFHFTLRPEWSQSVQGFRNSITEALMEKDNLSETEAREVFDREFWNHLNIHLNWPYQRKYGEPPNNQLDVATNLTCSHENIYSLLTHPNWSPFVQTMQEERIQAIMQQQGVDHETAQAIFEKNLWGHLLILSTWQYQRKYGAKEAVMPVNKEMEQERSLASQYQQMLSLEALLNPSSPYHKDFMPVYQSVAGENEVL